MMRAISGLRPLSSGSVWFEGRDISRVKAHQRAIDGLIQAPEGRGVFPGMTVTENLEMGCYGRKFDTKADRRERLDWVFETFPRLAERRTQVGGTLSGGEQQMLAIGRALMARPRVLLLDEPSMGLAPMIISQIFKIISEINAQGTTVLLVEQNAQQALSRSDRAYILETGYGDPQRAGPRVVGRRQYSRGVPRGGLTRQREHARAVLGDGDGVLGMRGVRAVGRAQGPAVRVDGQSVGSPSPPRFQRQGQARPQHQPASSAGRDWGRADPRAWCGPGRGRRSRC